MISHKHKCIFIHFQRTGGTSIENALVGKNWHGIDPSSKHIFASTAKRIYSDYWNDYFKFSFVRNPWDRLVSLASKYPSNSHLSIDSNLINVSKYLQLREDIELISGSVSWSEDKLNLPRDSHSVYLNTLNEPLDFIGKFENLQSDFNFVCDQIGINHFKLPHAEKSNRNTDYKSYYTEDSKNLIYQRYKKDIKHFNYEF